MTRKVKVKDEKGNIVEVALNPSIARLVDSSEGRLNDNDGIFFQRQLEAIEAQTYDVLYPDLEAREVFTTNTFGGAGAQTLTYRSFDKTGRAQAINARATDLPKSQISGREFSVSVKSVGVAYDYDIDEIAAAQMGGLPLESRKAEAARRGYEEYINSVTWRGDDQAGLKGFFDNTDVLRTNVAANSATVPSTKWEDKTPDEILADLNNACSVMYEATKKIHKPEEIWLSVGNWNYIFSTPRSPMSDTTIGEYFVKNNVFGITREKMKPLNELENGIQKGAHAGVACFVVVCQRSPEGRETVRIRETLPLQFLPPQQHGLVFEIPGRGRFAGLEFTYPRAIQIWYGI